MEKKRKKKEKILAAVTIALILTNLVVSMLQSSETLKTTALFAMQFYDEANNNDTEEWVIHSSSSSNNNNSNSNSNSNNEKNNKISSPSSPNTLLLASNKTHEHHLLSTMNETNNNNNNNNNSIKEKKKKKNEEDSFTCTPGTHQPVYMVSGRFETKVNAIKKMTSTNTSSSTGTTSVGIRNTTNNNNDQHAPLVVVCEFKTDRGMHWFHFPHSMQQLYACYSFYQQQLQHQQPHQQKQHARREEEDKEEGNDRHRHRRTKLFLLIPSAKIKSKLDSNKFLHGFLQLLQDEMGVEIVLNQTFFREIYPRYNQQKQEQEQQQQEQQDVKNDAVSYSSAAFYIRFGYTISHVHELNQLFEQYVSNKKVHGADETTTTTTTTAPPPSSSSPVVVERSLCGIATRTDDKLLIPRIGILNRRPNGGRSITNAAQLENILLAKIFSFHQHQQQVELEYFDGRSFEEQVQFFQRTDILISPHGAQLTGLPFLAGGGGAKENIGNTTCSQLLEIFPPNFLMPQFFGSLARDSDIGYSYLYLSDQAANYSRPKTLKGRNQARAANLCLSLDVIQKSIERLVGDWRECYCQQHDDHRSTTTTTPITNR